VKKLLIKEKEASTINFKKYFKFIINNCEVKEGIDRLKVSLADSVLLKEFIKEVEKRL
jgi:hypothetical protein